MEAAVHLPQIDFSGEGLSLGRVTATVDAARDGGFVAVSVNDHFVFSRPWLDGLTVLAAALPRSGELELVTTLALATLRGPVPLAKALATLDVLSEGRVVAGLGGGSSQADYDAVGVPFDERWPRLDEALALVKALLQGAPLPAHGTYYPIPEQDLAPSAHRAGGIPVWAGSWGSAAGLRRVARLGDGWLASAYNTSPDTFAAGLRLLGLELEKRGRSGAGFPHALVTMWTWITPSEAEADQVITQVIAPLVRRDPQALRGRICVGSAEMCAELLSRYAHAGCRRVHFWPVGEERRQVDLLVSKVLPLVSA
jgi:alkanesulfonate monooxygenase SsuD/methylene tetrahydromethanopterin reductase-like flavin-dependent oxidoreductase (luciferase family)